MAQFLLPELLEQCCDQAPPSRSLPAAFRTADARILGPVVPGVVFWSSVVPYVDATALSHDHYTAAVRTVRFAIAAGGHSVPLMTARGVVAQPEVLSQLDPALQDAIRSAAARDCVDNKQRMPVRCTDYNFVAVSQLRAWTGGLRKLTLHYWDGASCFDDAMLYLFRGSCSGTQNLECLTLRHAGVSPDLIHCIAESCPRLRHLSLLHCFSEGSLGNRELNALTVQALARAQWRGLKTLTMIGRYSRHVLLSQLFLHCCAEELRHRTGFCGNVIIPPSRHKASKVSFDDEAVVAEPIPLYKSLTALTTGSCNHMPRSQPIRLSDVQRLVLACPSLRLVTYGRDTLAATDGTLRAADRHTDTHPYNSPLYAEHQPISLKRQLRSDVVRRGKGKPPHAGLKEATETSTDATCGSGTVDSCNSDMQATGAKVLEVSARSCRYWSDVRSRGRAAIRAAVNGPLPTHDVLVAHGATLQRVVKDVYMKQGQHSKKTAGATASFDSDPHSSNVAAILSPDSCELFACHGLVSPQLPLLQSELQDLRKAQYVASKQRREARLDAKLHARASNVWSSRSGLNSGEPPVDGEALTLLSAADVGGPIEAMTGHVRLRNVLTVGHYTSKACNTLIE